MAPRRFVVVLAVMLLLAGTALAQMPNPFSADEVLTPNNRAEQPFTGKIYFDGTGRMRIDMNARGQTSTSIVDTKNKVAYTIMPQQQMYMEMNLDQIDKMQKGRASFTPYDASRPCANQPDYTCAKVGSESVNGRSCDKWEFTSKSTSKKHWSWIDQRNHIAIKTLMADGTTVEMKNIQEGPQPASLFQVPAGYRKMDMGGLMKNMPRPSK